MLGSNARRGMQKLGQRSKQGSGPDFLSYKQWEATKKSDMARVAI